MSEEKPKEKRCTKCGEVKALGEFYRRPECKDGYRSDCKECKKESSCRYHEQHSEERSEYSRRRRKRNLAKCREQERRYYYKNRDKVLERVRRRHQRNRDADIREILGMRDLLKALEDEVPPPEDEETTEPEIDPEDEEE